MKQKNAQFYANYLSKKIIATILNDPLGILKIDMITFVYNVHIDLYINLQQHKP